MTEIWRKWKSIHKWRLLIKECELVKLILSSVRYHPSKLHGRYITEIDRHLDGAVKVGLGS